MRIGWHDGNSITGDADMSKLMIAGLLTASLAGCATAPAQDQFTEASCGKAEISTGRSLYVCRGGPVNLGTFKRALVRKADPTLDPKEVALTFGIPPSEISGVVAASSGNVGGEQPDVVTVNRRTFASYRRDGATIFVERR